MFTAFLKGFEKVCSFRELKLIEPEELKLIVCGSDKLDFEALKASAKYGDGYKETSKTVKHLWDVLLEFDEEQKKKFLFFCTGCDKAPINGLGDLVLIIVKSGPDSDRLPTAHTCFNYLLLPNYKDKDKLKKLMLLAIENSQGFGLH